MKKQHITSLESLYQHLQWAVEVEHFTIPPYLCALFSIPEQSSNKDSAKIIKSVVMEEMLHMTLAANLMNAVGCTPIISQPGFLPDYPQNLPHSDDHFIVSLGPFSEAAVETFLKIEKPEKKGSSGNAEHYRTIGELYNAIEEGLEYLCKLLGPDQVFRGDVSRQVTSQDYYGGGGKIVVVECLDSARKAIMEVKEQGEGFVEGDSIWDDDAQWGQPDEPAHYYRFMEIAKGQHYQEGDTPESGPSGKKFHVDWDDVYKMKINPKVSDYPVGSEIRTLMESFNFKYTKLLDFLQKAFSGNQDKWIAAVGIMYELKYDAVALMQIPTGDGDTVVGPSFEFSYAYFRSNRTDEL